MRSPLARQLFVTLSMVTCTVGALVGLGILGRTVRDSVHGSLSADATLIAPAQPAFRIWQLIWLGLVVYTIWQWLPRRGTTRRMNSIGWLAGASMLLNGAWIFVTQFDLIWVSFAIMVALLALLVWIVALLTRFRPASGAEHLVVDTTFGLYLGWVAVAIFANVAAVGDVVGLDLGPTGNVTGAVAMLMVAAAAGIAFSLTLGARLAVALGMAWGFVWIAINRLTDRPYSATVGATAALAAVVVLAAAALIRGLAPIHRDHRAAVRAKKRPEAGPATEVEPVKA